MSYTRLNPKESTGASSSGLTVTPQSGYTVTLDYAKRYGNVVAAELHLTTNTAKSSGGSFNPFTTNMKYAVISGVYFHGLVPTSGNAWIKLASDLTTSVSYNFTMVGIL